MKCANHPDVETKVRCGKCGKPICPRCMIETPVGIRCRECAQLQKLPTFSFTKRHLLRAVGAAVGMAFGCGAAWWAIRAVMPSLYLDFLLAAGFGYAIGEVVGLSVNRKRGRWLSIIAGITVVVGYVISIFPPWGVSFEWLSLRSLFFDILAVALGVYVAISRVK